jgi:hypothetical protein
MPQAEGGTNGAPKAPTAPVIGRPSQPPPALVVAVSAHLTDDIRRARFQQFLRNTTFVIFGTAVAAGLAVFATRFASSGRRIAFAEAATLGVLLILGVLMRRRPLELGTGLISRSATGGIACGASLRALALLIPSAFREAAEGLIYSAGLMKSDPSTELASWLILALSPPHGPPCGTWVSLSGLSAAGFFSLPEDLRTALRALRSKQLVDLKYDVYPPQVRLRDDKGEFIKELFAGKA